MMVEIRRLCGERRKGKVFDGIVIEQEGFPECSIFNANNGQM